MLYFKTCPPGLRAAIQEALAAAQHYESLTSAGKFGSALHSAQQPS